MEKLLKEHIQNYKEKYILLVFENFYQHNYKSSQFEQSFLNIIQQNYNLTSKNSIIQKKIIQIIPLYNLYLYSTTFNKKIYFIDNNALYCIILNKLNNIINEINFFNSLFMKNHYNNIIKNPVLLDKKSFPIIKKDYSVTDKADGKRMLLFFNDKDCFLYSNEPSIQLNLQNKIKHSNNAFTLLDGEYLENLNQYLVFDGLFINGQNIQNFDLKNRLKFIQLFIQNIIQSSIQIKLKTFYFDKSYKDLCQNAHLLYNSNKDYHLDGLIYTPIYDSYFNRNQQTIFQTYKWKPLNENTIDFYILRLNPNLYGLVVSGGKFKLDQQLINKHFAWISDYKSIPIVFYKQPLYKYQELKDYENKIVEMFYDFDLKIFKVHRVRDDKIANFQNYKKQGIFRGPNGFNTALNTFQYIKNPLHTSEILCVKSNYWNNRENYSNKIDSIKKFHGSVKRTLYNSYLQKFNEPYVLEIGSGRGGDLNKLKINGVKYVLMTNINSGGINEARVRYQEMKNKKNFHVDFLVENSSKNITNKIQSIISSKNKNINNFFDIVSIQFALHYFLKTKNTFQNFFNNINSFLTPNGYIFATFLDGDSLNLLLKKDNIIQFMGSDNKPIFTIEKKYKTYTNYGSTILVTGKTIGSHEEYLVNIEFLKSFFEEHHYKIIDTQLFSTQTGFKNMKNGSDYSAINRYIVLQKL